MFTWSIYYYTFIVWDWFTIDPYLISVLLNLVDTWAGNAACSITEVCRGLLFISYVTWHTWFGALLLLVVLYLVIRCSSILYVGLIAAIHLGWGLHTQSCIPYQNLGFSFSTGTLIPLYCPLTIHGAMILFMWCLALFGSSSMLERYGILEYMGGDVMSLSLLKNMGGDASS